MDLGGVTWIVAADGGRARIFEERLRAGEIVERAEKAMEATDADQPEGHHRATVHERAGFGRHGAGEQPWREERANRFLRRVAKELDEAAAKKQFDSLVLIAPPRALGLLKAALPQAAEARLVGTEPHDCVRENEQEIRARLRTIRAGA